MKVPVLFPFPAESFLFLAIILQVLPIVPLLATPLLNSMRYWFMFFSLYSQYFGKWRCVKMATAKLNISVRPVNLMDEINKLVAEGRVTTLRKKFIFLLKFVDDIVFSSLDQNHLQTSINIFIEFCRTRKLVINESKSFITVVRGYSRTESVCETYTAGRRLKQVLKFRYLDFVLNEKANLEKSAEYLSKSCEASFYFFCTEHC